MSQPDNTQEAMDEDADCKLRSRGKKRKRITSESSSDDDVLPENTLEVEKNLHASALKNNLDDTTVKKILKKVVTNDHVLALVKLREEEENSGTEGRLRSKLTRAKAKELMKVSPNHGTSPWNLNLTPIKHIPVKTRPEVKALIAQELPEDEDDDEYEPNNDDVPSDDDHALEMSSDLESLPRTPATPLRQRKPSPVPVTDGPFKVPPQKELSTPVRKAPTAEETTIALRTRSKLSLSSTSIEHIESSFVPPDEAPTPDVDSLWNEFLKECLDPAPGARHEEDDEADPEYNVAADPDANDDDESLEKSILKISRKELNDLVNELMGVMPEKQEDQVAAGAPPQVTTCSIGKQEPMSDDYNMNEGQDNTAVAMPTTLKDSGGRQQETAADAAGKEENPVDDGRTQEKIVRTGASIPRGPAPSTRALKQKTSKRQPPLLLSKILNSKRSPIRIEIKKGECTITAEQRLLLEQQLRQHVQLAAGNFLQLFVHPMHWARAPAYKDYLVSLLGMVKKNPGSVVGVCNLQPALELVRSWEDSLSDSTEENLKMVAFIQKEMEKSRRRTVHHSRYVCQFPQAYLETVSNSNVFLYPYLLPEMPYRPDLTQRRASFLIAEDRLIALGMEQFNEYISMNPELYATGKPHPRHRGALSLTVELVQKHMLPWLSSKTLFCHVRHVNRSGGPDNPINKFFTNGKAEAVKHRLLPFNPRLTLYEQPEHEVPRLWLRHLAKTSQRFKRHLHSRSRSIVPPAGVDMELNETVPVKAPLPIDFTKEINCNRLNLLPKKQEPLGRIDVPIEQQNPPNTLIASDNIFTVVKTSSGAFLVPLTVQANAANIDLGTINSNTEEAVTEKPPNVTETIVINDDEVTDGVNEATTEDVQGEDTSAKNTGNNEDSLHCSCCVLLRKICKGKKWTIPDYFKRTDANRKCDCTGRRYPRMTKRLRYLLLNYKVHSHGLFKELQGKIGSGIEESDTSDSPTDPEDRSGLICDDNEERDLVDATLFQLKLTMTVATLRNNHTKCRLRGLFNKFSIDNDDVIGLAQELFKVCSEEMVPLYKEFVGFLTAEQADRLGFFKDYFIERCLKNLIGKIEELVPDKARRTQLLSYLQSKLFSAQFHKWPACDICTALLEAAGALPSLARHVFAMFPHRAGRSIIPTKDMESPADSVETPAVSQTAVNNVTKDASSREGNNDNSDELPEEKTATPLSNTDENATNIIKIEIEREKESDNEQTRKGADSDTSEMSRLVMSEDEMVKVECPEWKREEDKVILEVLKEHIAPEERKDKTILEVLEETQVLEMISDHLPSKSVYDVKQRILYLLHLLVGEVQ